MGFKENLKEELSYKGMLVKELSNLTGISQGSLSNYLKENSSIPSADVAVKISSALGVTVEYLVTGKELNSQVKEYSREIKIIINKLEKLSSQDIELLIAIIDKMVEIKRP